MTRFHGNVVLLFALGLVTPTGCSGECDGLSCGPCAPPLTLVVRLASGEEPMNVSVDLLGESVVCSAPAGSQVVCTAETLSLGPHAFVVGAEGQPSRSVGVMLVEDAGRCCRCGYQPIVREVVLGGDDGGT